MDARSSAARAIVQLKLVTLCSQFSETAPFLQNLDRDLHCVGDCPSAQSVCEAAAHAELDWEMCTCSQEMHALLCQQHTCTHARMQLRKRCAAAEQVVEPMQLAKHAKVLTDTFRARKRLVHEVHAVHGKSIATRAVSKETTVVTSATDAGKPAAPERSAIVRRRKVAVSAADAAPGKAESATSTEAPPKRRKRVVKAVKSPTKAAAVAGVAEAVLNTAATPAPVLPPLDPEGITAGLTHLASVNERALPIANRTATG